MTLVRISSTEYEDFRRFLEEACGILLGDNKHYLVQSRLGRMVNDNGVASLGDLVGQLRRERSGGPLREKVIEAMTTNETFWFRDNHPFQILSERILPEYTQRKQLSARVWSAACSTGQEPYSISITVQEFLSKNPGSLSDVQIVATDISPAVLEEAKTGHYDALTVARGLPPDIKGRYFHKDQQHWDERWQVGADIRKRVRFTQANLLSSYSVLGRFDVIFCRNVLIYFDEAAQKNVIDHFWNAMAPHSYLFIGHSESLFGMNTQFEFIKTDWACLYGKMLA